MLDAADLLELLCMQEMAVCQAFKVSTGACGRLHLAVAAARLLAAQRGAELGRVQQLLVHAVAEGAVLPWCMQQLSTSDRLCHGCKQAASTGAMQQEK